jgi:hypothetical protein
MQNNVALSSLALDLKRIALGLHRNSVTMADRFIKEALLRKNEIHVEIEKPYIVRILSNLDSILANNDTYKKAEDALMYSTLIQNYVLKNKGASV